MRIATRHLILAAALVSPMVRATDYYVDPAGQDANPGTNQAAPWRSLDKVNGTVFQPGDNVRFKRGGTWTGSLHPQGSGNSSAQITLGAYGEGAKPLINGNGGWAAISLSSQGYWTIDGFEVINPAGADSSRSGIRIDASGTGVLHRIRILNNDVHDVRGIKNVNDGGRNNGGIFIWINEPGKADDMLIQGNTVRTIHGQGIAFNGEAEYAGGGMDYANCSSNVVARGNTVLTTSGDGILMLGTHHELVEYNEVGYVGALSDPGNNIAAAWPTRHVNGVWQYNEVHHTAGLSANDSTAFDNDGFVKGATYFQYNYSHDNAGGFLMEYTWGGDDAAQTIVRYNISCNESRVFASNRNTARLYNNVFYNPGATLDVTWTPNPSYVLFSDNLFVAAGRSAEFSRQLFMNNSFAGGVTRPVTIDGNLTQDPLFVSPNVTGHLAGFILKTNSPVRSTGYIIADNGGKDFWGAPVPSAAAPHRGASQISSIAAYTSTPTFLHLTGADTLEIPAAGTNTTVFAPTVRDQNFRTIAGPAVTWSVSPITTGVTVDASGTLCVSSGAFPRRLAVEAVSGSATGRYTITLFTTQPVAYAWGGGTGNWSDINWNPGPAAGPTASADSAVIDSGTVNLDVGNMNVGSLTLGPGATLNAYNWNGVNTYTAYNHLILRGGSIHGVGSYHNWGAGILRNVTVTQSAASAISSSSFFNLNGTGGASSTFDVADASGDANADLTVSAVLADVSADTSWSPAALVKTGNGTMVLTAVNTYSGGTTVNAGTLVLATGNAGGTGRIAGTLTIQSGATVETTGDGTGLGWLDQVSAVALDGGTLTSAGVIHIWNIPGGITMAGGALQSNNGISDPNGPQLEWNRAAVTTLASSNPATIGGRIRMRADHGYAGLVFDVGDGAAATDLLVSAAITEASAGLSLTKSGPGTMALTGANGYTGPTVVNAGTLRLGNGTNHTGLADTADLVVATGAVVHLDFAGSDTLDELWLGGVLKPRGVYSSINGGGFLHGPGRLAVTNGPPSDYDAWAATNHVAGAQSGDDDGDGLSNFAEYAFGLDPDDTASAQPYTGTFTPGTGTFTYMRRRTSVTGLAFDIWVSTNLTDWLEDTAATQSAAPIPGTENELVEVHLGAAALHADVIFVKINAH